MGRLGERVERSSGAAPSRHRAGSDQNGPAPLSVRIEDIGPGTSIVALVGELDLSTVPRMEAPLLEQLRASPGVVVDLSGLSFVDSSGIGILIQASRAVPNGSRMHVVIARGSQVERVFHIAGVGEAVPLFFDREQAVAALADNLDDRRDAGA
jgi:anti-sigma B factor antagonist